MSAPTTFTPELAATIRGARLVGTRLRDCAKAAGVPWRTFCDWLAKGRAYNEAKPSERNPKHEALGRFAADIDRAGAQATATLHARVMTATTKDGRLAFDVLRWNEERTTRNLKRALIEAQTESERRRVSPVDSVHQKSDDEINARIAELLSRP